MLLRKNFFPLRIISDNSMRSQTFELQPFLVEVRGRSLEGSRPVVVQSSSLVNLSDADDYKLKAMLDAGVTPKEVRQSYFRPSIDDIGEMQRRLSYEEIVNDVNSDLDAAPIDHAAKDAAKD